MNVLGIDTSNQPMSVAVYKDDTLAAELTVNVKRNHSIQLMPSVEQVMKLADLEPKSLDEIVVSEGPGSFTGIRIGMTTAKTLAWTLNIPIKTVSSLKLLASNLIYQDGLVCPYFDARRGNVYTSLYRCNKGEIIEIEKDCNLTMIEWLEYLKSLDEIIYFTSPNGENFEPLIKDELGTKAIVVNQPFNLPRAGLLFALSQYEAETPIHTVKPNYIRITQAEANWNKQHGEGNQNESC
ncbi:tRNA (adenosine(37)-N6)-threonylcarbamoyltransferase complex dimerization subunit type 1 TsaB [Filobacillus milosensis]|uniref:tRNA (Adenosine(37)-N6)-threonylcarbamoyltransferase complex dimerization subunit type 1 TsaB n=1 Tax=Filobacillus milosensis TaxID=94137 RepID=A0A4Y8IEY4_9BACI|nr:tRNA (adenosine(37)-N6)-threonylcarbamoyltransferase complex dimerization subunit type 1 TsaB [Filobacillus milosensis]TFB13696.1 tRNA (adenosine(37)-N6)-threonylcarbamoyltransferase complex dimerization subunit type 1 TsaB [Filobacillus milosensis]